MNKKNMMLIIAICLAICFAACNKEPKPGKVSLKSFPDSLSYALGYLYGLDFSDAPFEFNYQMIYRGLINSRDPNLEILTEDQIMHLIDRFQQYLTESYQQDVEFMLLKNRFEGQEFMHEFAEMFPDAVVSDNGFYYRVINSGSGRQAGANSTVTVHYTGRLISGEIFDSSHRREEPVTIGVFEAFRGWELGLQLMREGDIFEFVFPDSLAFGEEGIDLIEPGAYVRYEIELIRVD